MNKQAKQAVMIEEIKFCYKRAREACLSTYKNNQYPPLAALNDSDRDIRHGATLLMYNLVEHEGRDWLPLDALKVLRRALDLETDAWVRGSLRVLIEQICEQEQG